MLTRPDKKLIEEIQRLGSAHDTHVEQCRAAYGFRTSQAMKQLDWNCVKDANFELWSRIRHYIGRLGSWIKASRFLVKQCRTFSFLKDSFDVEEAQAPLSVSLQPFRAVQSAQVNRLRHPFDNDNKELRQPCWPKQNCGEESSVPDYADGAGSLTHESWVHAEVILLELFHAAGKSFWRDDRYIGCSKASCYCCNLYFEHHPGDFILRPCHGNVWQKWSVPVSRNTTSGHIEVFTSVINNMLGSMAADFQIDRHLIFHTGSRPPDSATEISSRHSAKF